MRLIDADALQKEIDGIHQRHYANSCYQFIHDFVRAMIRKVRKAPTIDAVEVVRCKDCRYFKYGDYCDHDKMEHSRCRENDFCSYGERRAE